MEYVYKKLILLFRNSKENREIALKRDLWKRRMFSREENYFLLLYCSGCPSTVGNLSHANIWGKAHVYRCIQTFGVDGKSKYVGLSMVPFHIYAQKRLFLLLLGRLDSPLNMDLLWVLLIFFCFSFVPSCPVLFVPDPMSRSRMTSSWAIFLSICIFISTSIDCCSSPLRTWFVTEHILLRAVR